MELCPRSLGMISIVFFLISLQFASVSSERFVVGDNLRWNNGVNYTAWADHYHFHVGDWLVFYWAKGMYDVMEVNETAYNLCSGDHPITNWSRGDRWAFQLTEPKRYFFICSRGYCYNGMKLTIVAEPLPPPVPSATPPPPHSIAAPLPGLAAGAAVLAAGGVALTFALGLLC